MSLLIGPAWPGGGYAFEAGVQPWVEGAMLVNKKIAAWRSAAPDWQESSASISGTCIGIPYAFKPSVSQRAEAAPPSIESCLGAPSKISSTPAPSLRALEQPAGRRPTDLCAATGLLPRRIRPLRPRMLRVGDIRARLLHARLALARRVQLRRVVEPVLTHDPDADSPQPASRSQRPAAVPLRHCSRGRGRLIVVRVAVAVVGSGGGCATLSGRIDHRDHNRHAKGGRKKHAEAAGVGSLMSGTYRLRGSGFRAGASAPRVPAEGTFSGGVAAALRSRAPRAIRRLRSSSPLRHSIRICRPSRPGVARPRSVVEAELLDSLGLFLDEQLVDQIQSVRRVPACRVQCSSTRASLSVFVPCSRSSFIRRSSLSFQSSKI